jgi:hypothetical protein
VSVKLGKWLSPDERMLLKTLPQQVIDLLDAGIDEPSLRRLFPPAYASDENQEFEGEYRRLMGDDLRDRHREALQVLMATADADELDDEQAQSWLIALNELRLVLGTTLDVGEDEIEDTVDEDDPRAPGLNLYHYLSYLQDRLIGQL